MSKNKVRITYHLDERVGVPTASHVKRKPWIGSSFQSLSAFAADEMPLAHHSWVVMIDEDGKALAFQVKDIKRVEFTEVDE